MSRKGGISLHLLLKWGRYAPWGRKWVRPSGIFIRSAREISWAGRALPSTASDAERAGVTYLRGDRARALAARRTLAVRQTLDYIR